MRFEYKYIVHNSILEPLREAIFPLIDVDKYAAVLKNNQYTVRSVYLDTPRFEYYFEKIDGVKNRKKVRIRGYELLDSGEIVFLEIKRKYDIPILKHRAPLSFSQIGGMLSGNLLELNSTFESDQSKRNINRFLYQVFSKNLRPVVLVVYDREAYLSKFDSNVRITFDKNLRGRAYPSVNSLFEEVGMKSVMDGFFILEVKFNDHFPGWLKPILARYNLKKCSASKYVMCMDRCGVPGEIKKSTLFTNSVWSN